MNSFKTAFGEKEKVKADCSGESVVQQHMKDQCDINLIMKRWQKTGVLDHVKASGGRFIDCDGQTFVDACNLVIEAENRFMELPARVRKRFNNDPAQFIEFMDSPSPDDMQEAYELGLVEEPVQINKKNLKEADVPAAEKKSVAGED